jgi:hypothetical protein
MAWHRRGGIHFQYFRMGLSVRTGALACLPRRWTDADTLGKTARSVRAILSLQ